MDLEKMLNFDDPLVLESSKEMQWTTDNTQQTQLS